MIGREERFGGARTEGRYSYKRETLYVARRLAAGPLVRFCR